MFEELLLPALILAFPLSRSFPPRSFSACPTTRAAFLALVLANRIRRIALGKRWEAEYVIDLIQTGPAAHEVGQSWTIYRFFLRRRVKRFEARGRYACSVARLKHRAAQLGQKVGG